VESDIVRFVEYSDDALPDGLKWQILSFLRIVFPDGFVGANRYRDTITQPKHHPHHLLYVANDLVVSHVEVVHRQIEHEGATYTACAPTGVLTFPSFRQEGWGGKLVRQAACRIEASGVDLGLICCGPKNVGFYVRPARPGQTLGQPSSRWWQRSSPKGHGEAAMRSSDHRCGSVTNSNSDAWSSTLCGVVRSEDEAESASAAGCLVRGELGPGWTVDSARRLPGGPARRMYFVDAKSPRGRRHRLVLKYYPSDEPEALQTEIRGILMAGRAGVPVPEVIATDDRTGCILTTRLVGRPVIRPRVGWTWLVGRLAELLLTIHAANVRSSGFGGYQPYMLEEDHAIPSKDWTPDEWQRCMAAFRAPPPDGPVSFLHRDYHPGNVLWSSGRLTGVVDWSVACIGSPWADVAHCRFNLWRWHGEKAADAMVAEYHRLRPELPPYDPYWDIATAMSVPWPIRESVLRSATERLRANHS
jgi:aminoglycoside phosphotransferase (APT) family kinase protein